MAKALGSGRRNAERMTKDEAGKEIRAQARKNPVTHGRKFGLLP